VRINKNDQDQAAQIVDGGRSHHLRDMKQQQNHRRQTPMWTANDIDFTELTLETPNA